MVGLRPQDPAVRAQLLLLILLLLLPAALLPDLLVLVVGTDRLSLASVARFLASTLLCWGSWALLPASSSVALVVR